MPFRAVSQQVGGIKGGNRKEREREKKKGGVQRVRQGEYAQAENKGDSVCNKRRGRQSLESDITSKPGESERPDLLC